MRKTFKKIAITETYSVGSKVKEMFRELVKNKKDLFLIECFLLKSAIKMKL